MMNKSELVSQIAEKTKLTRSQSAGAVDAALDAIVEALKKGEEVRLVGFGTFEVVRRAPGVGRNLKTGEQIRIPESKAPKFRAGQALKEVING
jgi:DNA-binding protein HU-beta